MMRGTAVLLVAMSVALPARVVGMPANRPVNFSVGVASAASDGVEAFEEVWMAISINDEQIADNTLVLRRRGTSHFLVRRADWEAWRLLVPDVAAVNHNDDAYLPLDGISGLSYRNDDSRMVLAIKAAPRLFRNTELGGRMQTLNPSAQSGTGGFLNYDAYLSRATGASSNSLLLEMGAFNGLGAGTSSYLIRSQHEPSTVTRMSSTWNVDNMAHMATLRLGDAVSSPGAFGSALKFGGVQWATNFAMQPGFSTISFPRISGEAAMPSALDVYVNDMLRMRSEVPTGPFSINEIPLVTGQGEAKVVLHDAQGHEQVIRLPFQVSPLLLKPGLQEYSYSFGFLRRDYGVFSDHYGRWMGSITHRLGMTKHMTGETHAELMREQQTLGLTATYLNPVLGVASVSLAGSRAPKGAGWLSAFAINRQIGNVNVGAQTRRNGANFVLGTEQPDDDPVLVHNQVFANFHTKHIGSLGVSYQVEHHVSASQSRFLNGIYSFGIGKQGYCTLSWFRSTGSDGSRGISLVLSLPLENGVYSNISTTSASGKMQTQMQVQSNLPAGDGTGYRLSAGLSPAAPKEALFQLQNAHGRYALTAGRAGEETYMQANASGSVALMDGHWLLGRQLTDSFAVVEVPGYSDVHVYVDNQRIAQTGADGYALLPNLASYRPSQIRLDPDELPLDATLADMKLEAAPGYRAGQSLRFAVRHSHAAMLNVMLDGNVPLPLGAQVQLNDDPQNFPVGRSGMLYLTGLTRTNTVRVTWHGQHCEFPVDFAESDDPLPSLGTFACAGVKP